MVLFLRLALTVPVARQLGPAEDVFAELAEDGALFDLCAVGLKDVLLLYLRLAWLCSLLAGLGSNGGEGESLPDDSLGSSQHYIYKQLTTSANRNRLEAWY